MHDISKLSRELLQSEFEAAAALHAQILAAGFSKSKATALIYHAGLADGMSEARHWQREYHKLKHSVKEAPDNASKR